ncbi:hypothetical protein C7H19_24070 [Aphanothece hegewaldii CCALA 016]|uniref:DUF4132 domain-containing protein n=1 Tax=Aphanothece hegewaldii CCALA 016 TaxID=2107694 RepID=A0A2T1LQU7_9CHRO|nr:DUF5724 domain-containing protein [Aphanothece hegewaldii]PSF30032.1 hypothetical protein C7H19_24070 [Aphanothece hegewaldii CCALA 016]
MLTREQSQEQLTKLKNPSWKQEKLTQIPKLPPKLQEIAWGILGYDDKGRQPREWQNIYQFQQEAILQLDSLDSSERLTIFSLLFPKIATTLEQTWQLFPQLPYQSSYSRRAFRVPNHSELINQKRCQWFFPLLGILEGYDQDLPWLATWTPYISYYGSDHLGILFAAAINANDKLGNKIFSILVESAKGDHAIGAMGRHVTRGLLIASRPDGWEFIENFLLAAQRQEGLRQVILETVDEAHPEAFKRMIRLIIEHNLTRFSATVRTVDTWFGLRWESTNQQVVKSSLEQVLSFLESTDTLQEALQSEQAESVYFALWTLAYHDAVAAIPVASQFLNHPHVEHRFIAVYFLAQLDLEKAKLAIISAIDDPDLRVATFALNIFHQYSTKTLLETELFERLERNFSRFPEKSKELTPLVWEWMKLATSQSLITTALINNLGERSPKLLIPYLSHFDVYQRQELANKLSLIQPWDDEIRNILLSLIADPSQWVRQQIIKILAKANSNITSTEAIYLEKLLTRKSSDLRRGILQLLLNQTDSETLASAQRLLAAKQAPQRLAGLELLRELKNQKRLIEDCINYAKNYQSKQTNLSENETQLLEKLVEVEQKEATLEDALGLIKLEELTPIIPPKVDKKYKFVSTAAHKCLQSLDQLIEQHKHTPITIKTDDGTTEQLLGNYSNLLLANYYSFSEDQINNFPLQEVWLNWWQNRGKTERDQDGLELVRAIACLLNNHSFNPFSHDLEQIPTYQNMEWWKIAEKTLFNEPPNLLYIDLIKEILRFLIQQHPPKNLIDFLLDASATTFTLIPLAEINQTIENFYLEQLIIYTFMGWWNLTRSFRHSSAFDWTEKQRIKFWQMSRWLCQFYFFALSNKHSLLRDTVLAYRLKEATEADIIAYLLAENPTPELNEFDVLIKQINPSALTHLKRPQRDFHDLSVLTARKQDTDLDPILKELSDRCRTRIIEVELQRGDLPTAASIPALAIRSVEGIATLIKLLQLFGKNKLIRGYSYDNQSKATVFSHLIRISFPASAETPQDFAQAVKTAKIPEQQLIELAFYAPQWTNYVEYAIEQPNFTEGVWWIHAHTKDNQWHVPHDIKEAWTVQVTEKTPLSEQSLIDGAVDVNWFLRIYPSLDDKWQQLYDAAKYASSGAGHKRAQLFAEAMLGKIERETLINRITQKRNQDAVRALGLLPLKNREQDLLERYRIIQEFLRTSRQFGSQKQASEKLAVKMGLENLARNAGYRDPQHLQWAMEAQAISDLVKQPQTATIDEVSVSLAITSDGKPKITIIKQGKSLKAVPTQLKKNPKIVELQNRKQDITRQTSRMRLSLEEAMCRGDSFTVNEFQQLCTHPILAPMLEQLIFIGQGEIGYPVEKGTAFKTYNGKIKPIKSQILKIAHSYDLLQTEWHHWQQECFTNQRTQPFKQIFRELYVLTPTETANHTLSRRYEGQQINPKQALALWGQRGWVTSPDEGVRRTFHEADISAWVTFQYGFYTPLEMEGLTIEGVYFTKRGEGKELNLSEVPPQLFSETMRDLDLVVSVAHLGGVDPEASASTVEMRRVLIEEFCRLLKLKNVQLQNSHAVIEGSLGNYSIHLGSGIIHRQPGGTVCIIPVHSQHRGRLFLPFADSDPKTAEILSKVILLAKDKEIKDPSILEQIL